MYILEVRRQKNVFKINFKVLRILLCPRHISYLNRSSFEFVRNFMVMQNCLRWINACTFPGLWTDNFIFVVYVNYLNLNKIFLKGCYCDINASRPILIWLPRIFPYWAAKRPVSYNIRLPHDRDTWTWNLLSTVKTNTKTCLFSSVQLNMSSEMWNKL